jgi:hypothetical protein
MLNSRQFYIETLELPTQKKMRTAFVFIALVVAFTLATQSEEADYYPEQDLLNESNFDSLIGKRFVASPASKAINKNIEFSAADLPAGHRIVTPGA